jgi:S-DNA-T family DNA segregation ATPase FtsK/SpoIIIE
VLPPLDLVLEAGVDVDQDVDLDKQRARLIEETLGSFGAPVRVVEINRGPTITQFGVEPDFIETRSGRTRVRVSKITSLSNDLALALSARSIRVEAPVPGKGFIGIEVPNDVINVVALRDVIESEAFRRLKSPLRFALGLNVSGQAVAADLAAMPHLLIAGQTGSGKSVCVNALISCLLANNTPDDLRLIMVDPKRVELTGYNGIPHLLAPVVVELERVVSALQWVSREMDMRYRKLAEAGSRNIQDYNAKAPANAQRKLPYLVVIIDELADLMMLAPDETERTITRLAQLARATGIHLVIATQRPSVDVVTGLIKANFPARVAFAVASNVDSRVILDQPGAETLLGRGDMLFQAPDAPAPVRLQGVFVSDTEIFRLVSYWQSFAGLVQPAPIALEGTNPGLPGGVPLKQMAFWDSAKPEAEQDSLYSEAVDLSRRQGRASISMLQRRLHIGYTRAARIIDAMEENRIVGPPEPGSGVREILDYGAAAPPIEEN